MMKRLITAAVAIPVVLVVTLYSPAWLFALVTGAVAAMMLDEYLALSVAKGKTRPGRWFLFMGAMVTASFVLTYGSIGLALTASALCLLTSTVLGHDLENSFDRVAAGLSGLIYCCVLPGFLVLIRTKAASGSGAGQMLVLFAVVWAGDSAAYFGGRTFGRHLLAPRVSPKKTVEGAIAGLLGSVIGGTLIGLWRLGGPWSALLAITALTAIAGQIGDLAESALKRSAGVKDSSSILPGHGGILDRLDSLLFAAPVFFWLFNT
jgi:phosphatidate cytidylyltransferase